MHHLISDRQRTTGNIDPRARYEDDFTRWLEGQIALIRARQFDQLDVENLLDELEGGVRRGHRELRNRLEILLLHLLKCQYQRRRKSAGWLGTLGEQRAQLADLIEESPSLSRCVAEYAHKVYPRAMQRAAIETGLPPSTFPSAVPWSVAQILDLDFVP